MDLERVLEMPEMLTKLENCHTRLQNLAVQPTKSNMEILLQTLYDLTDVYNAIKEKI